MKSGKKGKRSEFITELIKKQNNNWICKIVKTSQNELEESILVTHTLLTNLNFESLYYDVLKIIKNIDCCVAAIYYNSSLEDVIADDVMKKNTDSFCMFSKGCLGDILLYRIADEKMITIRERQITD